MLLVYVRIILVFLQRNIHVSRLFAHVCILVCFRLTQQSYIALPVALFCQSSKKKKKKKNLLLKKSYIFSKKIFLTFLEIELSGPKIKFFFIFSEKKLFPYFLKWEPLKQLLIFQEGSFRARKKKRKIANGIILANGTFKVQDYKIYYISGNGPFQTQA